MRLQKATRFALYAAIELASEPQRQLSAGELAALYGASPHHMAKVLRDLGRAGLVEAERGAGGGYRFVGNARRLTLMDVVELFEPRGGGQGAGPAEPGEATPVGVALGTVLREIDEIAEATLRSISLETLLRLRRRQQKKAAA